MICLTVGVAAETPSGEKCQRMKNRTRVTLKNLCIKTKAWNFKKHLLQGDMQTNINWKKKETAILHRNVAQKRLDS